MDFSFCGEHEMSDEDKSLYELIEEWREQNKAYNNEGTTGVKNLNSFVKKLNNNYSGKFSGSPIEDFLKDNPGCIEAIWNWIADEGESCSDWQENIISDLIEEDKD